MSVQGSGFLGSDSLETSVANAEIIPTKPSSWTYNYKLYKFSLFNTQECVLVINGDTSIFLRAGQGFSSDQGDKEIESAKITTNGISYNWVGAY